MAQHRDNRWDTRDKRASGFPACARDCLAERESPSPVTELEQVLAAATSEGMVVLGADGVLLRANPRARSMLGWSDQDLGQPVGALVGRAPFAESDGVVQPVQRWPGLRALAGETIRALDIGLCRDGRTTWLSTTALPVTLPSGECGGALVCMIDVTARHTLEQHHERMLRLIAHDMRNPLTSVHLNAQLLGKLLAEKGLEREQRLADLVVRAARRLDAMIQELVDSAKLRSGQLRLDLRPVSVVQAIPEMLARNAASLDTSRVRLLLPDGPIMVIADVARLERVLINLLMVALQNCPDKAEVSLHVSMVDNEVRFALDVPGHGQVNDQIPSPPRGPFAQAKNDQDFGMGLFLARMLVERHGGRLWVEGSAGQEIILNAAIPVAGPGDV
jgi:PAS domain S-box-containing protein